MLPLSQVPSIPRPFLGIVEIESIETGVHMKMHMLTMASTSPDKRVDIRLFTQHRYSTLPSTPTALALTI